MINEGTLEAIALELKLRRRYSPISLSFNIVLKEVLGQASIQRKCTDINFEKEMKLSLYADNMIENLKNLPKMILQTIREFHIMSGYKINIQNQKTSYLQTTNR